LKLRFERQKFATGSEPSIAAYDQMLRNSKVSALSNLHQINEFVSDKNIKVCVDLHGSILHFDRQ
jgi:hypothetical protein